MRLEFLCCISLLPTLSGFDEFCSNQAVIVCSNLADTLGLQSVPKATALTLYTTTHWDSGFLHALIKACYHKSNWLC